MTPRVPRLRPRGRAARRALALAIAAAALAGRPLAAAALPDGYALVWSDEFSGDQLDRSRWTYHDPGPRREAVNIEEAARLDGAGHLVIDTWTQDEVHYTTIVSSEGLFEPTFGWFEARVEFHGAPGMWSAFWLQSPRMGAVIGDAVGSGVEIDVQEHRAECAPGCDISDFWQGAFHWDGYGADHKAINAQRRVAGLREGFHTYALEWTPDAYRIFVDGELLWQPVGVPVSHAPEYVLLSSEVESVLLWAGEVPAGGYGPRSGDHPRMVVDYVRVYQLVPEPGSAPLLALGLAALCGTRASRGAAAFARRRRALRRGSARCALASLACVYSEGASRLRRQLACWIPMRWIM
jgi:beta-glucanase (GH16 family)